MRTPCYFVPMNTTFQRKIEILPESVKHMIAAGEVVQGPFSVIKELVENSIDADAASIDIMTEDAGLSCIRVIDDGRGIPKDQITLSIVEHATSKIRSISDIESISSYGFRGEALSSIASVSHLTISSRTSDEEAGARLRCVFGESTVEEYLGARGTSVLVEELFFNTPARKKFLKSLQGESRNSLRAVTSLALARPGIAFRYTCDGKILYDCTPVSSVSERIAQLFGKKEMPHLLAGDIADIEVKISGVISDGSLHKPTRGGQYFFVNNRPVENSSFSFHVRRAYDSILANGRHPLAYIYITLPPGLADVNVHPAKREIRFFDEAYIGSLICSFCRSLLDRTFTIQLHNTVKAAEPDPSEPGVSAEVIPPPDVMYRNEYRSTVEERESPYAQSHPFLPRINRGTVSAEQDLFRSPVMGGRASAAFDYESLRIFGTLFATYVLAASDDDLMIIDFHAAHERILYDRLMRADGACESQLLMMPQQIHFSPQQRAFVSEVLEILAGAGFDVELFSDESFVVRAVPGILHLDESEKFFDDLLEQSSEGSSFLLDKKKLVFERIACHSAKRAGDHMNNEDLRELLRILSSGNHELRCPHGRPFIFKLSRGELEKYFSRRV